MPPIILSGIGRRLLSAGSDDGQELALVVIEEPVNLPAFESGFPRDLLVEALVFCEVPERVSQGFRYALDALVHGYGVAEVGVVDVHPDVPGVLVPYAVEALQEGNLSFSAVLG